jgi:NADH-quinone oxidoreductase subunit M
MILLWLIALLLLGGLLAAIAARWSSTLPRWISLAFIFADLALGLRLWFAHATQSVITVDPRVGWLERVDLPWVPQFGIRLHLAMDGLSLLLVMLTFFLGLISVLASWSEIRDRIGFFHLNLMWILAGIVGVFTALDLFLFYFAWELMLIPMYFLIAIWGHENRVYAAVKFFMFTQLSGLLMLIAILALYFFHHSATGVYTFNYLELLGTPLSPAAAGWLMMGFFIAFAVKLPMVPFHTWLPDAHTEAPTAGSIILAGLMLKTGGYGIIRLAVPLFPDAAREFSFVGMALGVAGILYGALLAFGQTDLKRLVAYTSVSHLGFVLLGIFAWNDLALQGAVLQMICHGISTGALFMLVGALQERIHTREIDRTGGLWSAIPRFSGAALVFALASLGLPGLGDFVGEFLVLLGSYAASPALAAIAATGMIASALYALRMVQRTLHGPNVNRWRLPDLSAREALAVFLMIATLVWLGLYPQPVLNTFHPVIERLSD